MKRLIPASVATLAILSMMGAANAADILRRDVMPMNPSSFYVPYNWTGFYIGLNGGGGWGTSDFGGSGFSTAGGLVGGTLGYNWQIGQGVFGLEGDFDWSNIGASNGCPPFSCEVRNHWLSTVRGRFGYAFDSFMPYVTGGLAIGEVETTAVGLASTTDTKLGWTIGAGVEGSISGPWTAKVEYLYIDLGNSANTDFRTHVGRVGLNYRF